MANPLQLQNPSWVAFTLASVLSFISTGYLFVSSETTSAIILQLFALQILTCIVTAGLVYALNKIESIKVQTITALIIGTVPLLISVSFQFTDNPSYNVGVLIRVLGSYVVVSACIAALIWTFAYNRRTKVFALLMSFLFLTASTLHITTTLYTKHLQQEVSREIKTTIESSSTPKGRERIPVTPEERKNCEDMIQKAGHAITEGACEQIDFLPGDGKSTENKTEEEMCAIILEKAGMPKGSKCKQVL